MRKRLFKISIDDESHLQSLASWTMTPARIIITSLILLAVIFIAGFLLICFTPARQLVPGYFRESERAITENALLRVDSLRNAYQINQAYLANLRKVLDTDRLPTDSMAIVNRMLSVAPDSLLPPSKAEVALAKRMQQSEKFNISVQSTMAAEGMLFYPISEDGVQTAESKDDYKAVMILPVNTSVMAMADAVVIASFRSDDATSSGHYNLILQHDNGFVSRYSGLGMPLVGNSDYVAGGEILSMASAPGSHTPPVVTVEIWHNGIPVKPFNYINSHRHLRPSSLPSSNININNTAQ